MNSVIYRVEDQDNLIIQNSIRYLFNLTQKKQLDIPTIKSLYRTKCRLMELRRHIFIPQQKQHRCCQRCFMNFSEGETKFEVQPVKLSCFAKKIIAKAQKKSILTSYQKTYYKKLLKKFPNGFQRQNKLVLTCNFCKKEMEICMEKPKKVPKKDVVTPAKKKSKKKDKFCGLNASVVCLSSSKKKKKAANAEQIKPSLDTTNLFVVPEKSNMNTSVSMTNARTFQTLDFIPLESNTKVKHTIKISKNKEKDTQPVLPGVVKAKEKIQKKNMSNLSNILKKASENKGKSSSKLKNFLDSLST